MELFGSYSLIIVIEISSVCLVQDVRNLTNPSVRLETVS